MKNAILYVRVSSDEQAQGYSLGAQQEILERYCLQNELNISKLFIEDYSAKNFERPEFKKLLEYSKVNQNSIDYLLFVQWDRFSRNIADSYLMLEKFKKFNIEPKAIMQPLDFTVPQSKLILAVYLSLPEVDNDIRSEKIKMGIRRAHKLGRWTANAPIGFKNARDESNKPIIVPHPERSEIIKWIFEEVAKGEKAPNVLRLELHKKGIKICKTSFYKLLKNPVYIGQLSIKANESEPSETVNAIHEAIITEELFYRVQNVISNKRKKLNKQSSFTEKEELPLRGMLECSKCGKHVTGSASKSRTGARHFYYHCNHCKTERYKADLINNEVEQLLEAIELDKSFIELYESILEKEMLQSSETSKNEIQKLNQEKIKLEERKESIQNNFIDGKLSPSEYSEIKTLIENKLLDIKLKLSELVNQKSTFKTKIKESINFFPNLVERYRNSSVQEKKIIIGSIFPQKFIFKNNQVRTTEINPIIALILNYSKDLIKNKKGQMKYYSHLSSLVVQLGIEPSTY